ncbi:MAG: phosphatase PAP2 family protein [Bacteroidales bacterium]|nr:phosphatase PAP2 family protein [Bacteroidales bacterium]
MIGYNLPSIIIFSCSYVIQSFDVDILKEINLNRNTQFDAFFQIVTNSVSIIAWGIPILLLITGIAKQNIRLRSKALFLLISVVLSSGFTQILKYAIDRPRPFITYDFVEKISSGGSPSFPSGHTSEAFAIAIALCFAYPRWFIIIPSIIWAIMIGYSRMSLGVHYPSDVLAGVVIGVTAAWVCYRGWHFYTGEGLNKG